MRYFKIIQLLKLNELFIDAAGADTEIGYLSSDSRQVPGDNTLFFVKGFGFQKEYLSMAIYKGSYAYVAEKKQDTAGPYILVKNVRLAMALIGKHFYKSPQENFLLTGITGTKGKTTTTYMLNNIFAQSAGLNSIGMISTNKAMSGTRLINKQGTTPEALELYNIFDSFYKDGVKAAFMEVSSQGLKYNRVEYIDFDIGVFLNLSPDHISPAEHRDFEEYKAAKKKLLTQCRTAVINIDDPSAKEMISESTAAKIYTFGIESPADFTACHISSDKYCTTFTVKSRYMPKAVFAINIPGGFNVYNALAAIAVACIQNIDLECIKKGLFMTGVPGRMKIQESNGITAIVDYAHNELSFREVFKFAGKFYQKSQIICVFGCPGDKALNRRRDLIRISAECAGKIILTSDDPGSENPRAIMNEILMSLPEIPVNVWKIQEREQAIKQAFKLAVPGDVILILGKGHEHYQVVNDKKTWYKGDWECAREGLQITEKIHKIFI